MLHVLQIHSQIKKKADVKVFEEIKVHESDFEDRKKNSFLKSRPKNW